MKVVKSACVLWGSLYLCVGWLEAWSYNSTDTIESLVVLLALFVLPLPIALLSIRLPKAAGTALLACVALSFAAAISFEMRRAIAFADYPNVFAHLAAWSTLHLLFGTAYIGMSRAESPDHESTRLGTNRKSLQATNQ